jgi:hypothetical protein
MEIISPTSYLDSKVWDFYLLPLIQDTHRYSSSAVEANKEVWLVSNQSTH